MLRGMMPEHRPMEADKPTYEQMKEVIDLAEMFDALQHLPVWQKVLERMAATMNHELVEAANKKYDREARMMHVDMYHAKREINVTEKISGHFAADAKRLVKRTIRVVASQSKVVGAIG